MSSDRHCDIISFSVVHVSSEHFDHPGSCLASRNTDAVSSMGWQSTTKCSFPQHVIIKLAYSPNSPGSSVSLSQIKVLTHETKIPKRVEIFLATRPNKMSENIHENDTVDQGWNEDAISFQRLGYVSFDCNERSNFRARELKSIKLGGIHDVSFIKLVLHECHGNIYNPDNQVGIVNITVLGEIRSTMTTMESKSPVPCRINDCHDIMKSGKDDNMIIKENVNNASWTHSNKRKGVGHAKRLEVVKKENEHVETEVKQRIEALEKLKHMKAAIEVRYPKPLAQKIRVTLLMIPFAPV